MTEGGTQKKIIREVLVVPLAARREALILLVVISLIILLMALRFSLVRSVDTGNTLKSYQLSDLYLQNQAPVLYRALLGSVADILDLREENGSWPDIDLLKTEALPPFAGNFLPVGLRGFVWQRHTGDGWVDYCGINGDTLSAEKQGTDPLENSFILRVIDLQSENHPHPHQGRDNDPAVRFTYQIWMNPQVVEYPGEALVERGWKWVVGSSQGEAADVVTEQAGR